MLKRCSFLVCFAFALSVTALADDESGPWGMPWPYTMESSDKRYIFVMLRSCLHDEDAHSDKYRQSGLYLNDGSTAPLWTVDWRGCSVVLLPSDGVHVVRKGVTHDSEDYTDEAITFFSNGSRLKSYRVCDLVPIPWLLPHANHGVYEWWRPISAERGASAFTLDVLGDRALPGKSGVVFDDSAQTMTLETLQGYTYLFDLNTGEVISVRSLARTIAMSLLAFFVLFYAWYLIRATARRRLPLGKLYQRLAFNTLAMAWLVSLLGLGIITAARYTQDEIQSPVYAAALRVFVEAPIVFAHRNEWAWASPFHGNHPYYAAQGVLYLLGFWFAIFAVLAMTNSALVRCLRSARRRWTSRASPQATDGSGPGETNRVAPAESEAPRFKEVQHFSRFWLGLIASFLSIFAAVVFLSGLNLREIREEDPLMIPLFVLIGVLLPAFFLNVKMVTHVRDNGVVVGLRLLWLQKKNISFDEIRQCSIQPRHSHEQDELMVHRYAVWAPLGVMLELMEGDWILIGSQRPHELLEAIRQGQRKTPSV